MRTDAEMEERGGRRNHGGKFSDITNHSEFDSRTRLLRSQLRRQRAMEQLKLNHRWERAEQEMNREDYLPSVDVRPYWFFPPVYSSSEISAKTSRNTKSDLVDLMMMQSFQATQMMSQRMALSLVTPGDSQQSQTSRTREKDRLLMSLILDAVKDKYPSGDVPARVDRPICYLPVLNRLPIPAPRKTRKQAKPVLEKLESTPVLMTSRWKARSPEQQDPPLVVGDAVLPSRKTSQNRRTALRKFRLAAYCAVFISIMKGRDGKRLMHVLRKPVIDDDVITGIRIKECVQALHKVYLNPERKMQRILRQIYDPNLDLTVALTESGSREQRHKATETLASFIEHVVYEMTFVPTATGSLGTENRSHLHHLLRPQQTFPVHYFWGVEKELLAIDSHNRTAETFAADHEFILLIGLCLGRALVATLLRYPHQFGLANSVRTEALSTKVRLVVTIFIYLIRKLYAPPNGIAVAADFPEDLSKKLFTDEAMGKLYKKLQTSFDYAERLLRDWGQNYIKQLRRA